MNLSISEYIAGIVSQENVILGEPLSRHTTFKVGGDAECFVKVSDRYELEKLLSLFNRIEQEYFVIGNGSNLLVSDKGYQGVILQIKNSMNEIKVEGNKITAQAGALIPKVSKTAMEAGLSGLEFASGIPGTVGGGIIMNAGAYGAEMGEVVELVTVMNKQGEVMELDNSTMNFAYRSSSIKNRPFIVLEVVYCLTKGNREEIREKMEEYDSLRREKQPLSYPSAGSAFKRPEGNYAGKLIMEAGLKGYQIGGAMVSDKHCGFIVNTGNATGDDIYKLIKHVQETVKEKTGISLEREVVCLGEF